MKSLKMFGMSGLCLALLFPALAAFASSHDGGKKMTEAKVSGYESHEKMGIPEGVDPIHETYLPVIPGKSFKSIMQKDVQDKPKYMERQKELLNHRYDLSDRPSDVMMSAGRKAVQEGVRVKLPEDVSWADLNAMTPAEIKNKGVFPGGFLPLPHA